MTIGLIDAAHIFRDRDNVKLKQELASCQQEAELARELIQNPILRALVSIVDGDKRDALAKGEWAEGVNVTHATMDLYLGGGGRMWEAPPAWCRRATPFLQHIGLDVILYNDDSDVPMFIRWHAIPSSEEELEDLAARGWELHTRTTPGLRRHAHR